MADTHPFRTAADVVDGNLTEAGFTETFLDALKKRVPVAFSVTEEVSTFNFSVGSPPLALLNASTGYVYFLNPDDTTTPPDLVSFTVLVTEDGRRYILADSSALALSSVLGIVDSPPDGSPEDAVVGDAYVVSVAPTGAFVAHAKDIALLTQRGWVFAQPQIGAALLNQETGLNIQYSVAGEWGAMATALNAADVAPEALLFPAGLSVEAQQNAPPVSPSVGQHYLVGTAGSGLWSGYSNYIAYYTSTSVWAFIAAYDGATIFNKASDTSLTWYDATGDWRPPWPYQATCQGRLTLESGVAISITDQAAKATLYFTPFRGNNISLYVNGGWALRNFTQKPLSLAGHTASKNYDIFGYDNAGVLALESLVWTSDTARATALVLQDGILVKSGDATRLYLGTIRINATGGQTDLKFGGIDAAGFVGIWNYNNRTKIELFSADSSNTYSYNSATWRAVAGSSTLRHSFVSGVAEDSFAAEYIASVAGGGSTATIGIGLDSTSARASRVAQSVGAEGVSTGITARIAGIAPLGFHFLAGIESGPGTYVGDNGEPDRVQSGFTMSWSY